MGSHSQTSVQPCGPELLLSSSPQQAGMRELSGTATESATAALLLLRRLLLRTRPSPTATLPLPTSSSSLLADLSLALLPLLLPPLPPTPLASTITPPLTQATLVPSMLP